MELHNFLFAFFWCLLVNRSSQQSCISVVSNAFGWSPTKIHYLLLSIDQVFAAKNRHLFKLGDYRFCLIFAVSPNLNVFPIGFEGDEDIKYEKSKQSALNFKPSPVVR